MDNSVSIIVPCYNSELTIEKCALSILKNIENTDSPNNFELIIVNDGSNDATKDLIKNINNAKIINHNKNQGLSAARNSGIKKSNSEYIIFIDSDIILSDNWIKNIYYKIKENKDVVGIIGNLEPEPNKKVSSLDKYLFGAYRGTKKINFNLPLNYKSFVFSNTIIKKNILDQVGLFDESLVEYGGEDTELAIRIHKIFPMGLRKIENIHSYHITKKTVNQHINYMFEYGQNNFLKIIKKHPDYKNDLGYQWIGTIKGNFLFNFFTRSICKLFLKRLKHPLIIKFLVIDAFIRGAKSKI
tara:strand:+ start:53 stop:949 length:897 start_codon:yes stop_codon:yes gene_type:complete